METYQVTVPTDGGPILKCVPLGYVLVRGETDLQPGDLIAYSSVESVHPAWTEIEEMPAAYGAWRSPLAREDSYRVIRRGPTPLDPKHACPPTEEPSALALLATAGLVALIRKLFS